MIPYAMDTGHGATGFNVCLFGFWSLISSFFAVFLFFSFGMGMFILYNDILEEYNSF
jgi:hypothetical protein